MTAADRALHDIAYLEREQHISAEMAQRGRDVVGLIFQPGSVYASIGPVDSGDLSFYWRAGKRSIGVDLYREGGLWCEATDGNGRRRTHCGAGLPRWMWDALADFSEAVEAANPNWREQTT